MNSKKIIKFLFLMFVFFVITVGNKFSLGNDKVQMEGELVVTFLDVGQGDAIFIEIEDVTLLIDAGESEYGDDVVSFIENKGYDKIDYVIGTHPHSDHIGGLSTIISSFEVDSVFMPKVIHTTKTYENLLTTIIDKGLKVKSAKEGVSIYEKDGVSVSFIAPISDEYSEINNYSAVVKLVYGNNSFMFMGDAESFVEDEISGDVRVDVIKVGHHGSDTSSSSNFVNRVNPSYAIISVGESNQYNLPKDEVINRWKNSGATVLRTDESGNITFLGDGNNLKLETEK